MATALRSARRPIDVIVLGAANVDFVCPLDHLPRAGETVVGPSLQRFFGGKGANQAAAAASTGAATAFIGAVGDDELGQAVLADLRSRRVNVSWVQVVAGTATGVALIMTAGGENIIAVALGANGALETSLVDTVMMSTPLAPPAVALLSAELPDAPLEELATRFASQGHRVLVNLAPARPLSTALRATQPIVVVNEREAASLMGIADPAASVRALSDMTGAPALVTLGPRGVVIAEGTSVVTLPAAPVDEVVDSTGAGDAFCGVLAGSLALGLDLVPAAAAAIAAAGRCVSCFGARSWLDEPGTAT